MVNSGETWALKKKKIKHFFLVCYQHQIFSSSGCPLGIWSCHARDSLDFPGRYRWLMIRKLFQSILRPFSRFWILRYHQWPATRTEPPVCWKSRKWQCRASVRQKRRTAWRGPTWTDRLRWSTCQPKRLDNFSRWVAWVQRISKRSHKMWRLQLQIHFPWPTPRFLQWLRQVHRTLFPSPKSWRPVQIRQRCGYLAAQLSVRKRTEPLVLDFQWCPWR